MKFAQHRNFVSRVLVIAIVFSLGMAHPVAAMQALSDELEAAFEAATSWESGDSPQPLRVIRNAVWQADAKERPVLEEQLIALLREDQLNEFHSAIGVRLFAIEQLTILGSDRSIQSVIRLSGMDEPGRLLGWFVGPAIVMARTIDSQSARTFSAGVEAREAVRRVAAFEEPMERFASTNTFEFDSALAEIVLRKDWTGDPLAGWDEDGDPTDRINEYTTTALNILGQRGAQEQLEEIREELTAEDQPSEIRVATYLAMADATRGNQINERNTWILDGLESATTRSDFTKVFQAMSEANDPIFLAPLAYQFEAKFHGRDAARTALQLIPLAEDDVGRNTLKIIEREFADDEEIMQQAKLIRNELEREEDFITKWKFTGPYADETIAVGQLLNEEFPPEGNQPEAASGVDWQPVPSEAIRKPGRVNLNQLIGGSDRVGYLKTTIRSEKSQPARLEIGSDDGCKVWLNNKLIHTANEMRGLAFADDIVNIDLQEGDNVLLIKVLQGGGDWEAAVRLRGRDGERLDNLNW